MKRFQSMLSATLLTLAISVTTLAGNIHGVTGAAADGNIHGIFGDIHGIFGDIHGVVGSIASFVAQSL